VLGYRHIFHAGNHADVLKHAVLTLTLQALLRKEKPFAYIDTHAGAGLYPLDDPRAQRTAEYVDGIARWWEAPVTSPVLAPLMDILRAENPDGELRRYPGSPAIARHLLRPEDRMVLFELHPADHQTLVEGFGGSAGVRIEQVDAFARLKAYVPPQERRGVVLIDPPYELKSDYAKVVEMIADAHRRWSTGVFLLWYPVLSKLAAQRFVERLASTGIPRQLCIEYLPFIDDAAANLLGSGMLIINPPFKLDAALADLAKVLSEGAASHCRVRWTVPE
jgi:23S rRNA (adenine2030-N6)-methyltransferase